MSKREYPALATRLFSIWIRHFTIYRRNIISNAISPFIDPLLFIVGIGLGLGVYIGSVNYEGLSDIPFITFLTSGIAISSSMFTAVFETTYGTHIRLYMDKVYDGMLGSPITAHDIIFGEGLWAGTKGLIFCLAIAIVGLVFDIIPVNMLVIAPILGFVSGIMFAALGFFVTSFVNTINHYSILFTAVLSPMFFFSGVIFPLENIPAAIRPIAEILPLTHPVRIGRALTFGIENKYLLFDLIYIIAFIIIIGGTAIYRIRKKLLD